METLSREANPRRIVELGTCGQARYAGRAGGETIWWGSEEDVPDAVALAASDPASEAGWAQMVPDGDQAPM